MMFVLITVLFVVESDSELIDSSGDYTRTTSYLRLLEGI